MPKEKIEQSKQETEPLNKRLLESIEITKAAKPEMEFRGYRGEEVPNYEFSGKAEELGELVNRMKKILLRDDEGLKEALDKEFLTNLEQKVKNLQESLIGYEKVLTTGKTDGVTIFRSKIIQPLVREIYLPGRLIETPSLEKIHQAHTKKLNELAKNDSLFEGAPSFKEFKDDYPEYSKRSVFNEKLWLIKLNARALPVSLLSSSEKTGMDQKKEAEKIFGLLISYEDDLSCEVPEANQKIIKRMNEILWEAMDKQN